MTDRLSGLIGAAVCLNSSTNGAQISGDLEKLPTHAAYDGNFVNVTESNQERTRINQGRFRGGLPGGAIFRGPLVFFFWNSDARNGAYSGNLRMPWGGA
jgi:hypothetical protein